MNSSVRSRHSAQSPSLSASLQEQRLFRQYHSPSGRNFYQELRKFDKDLESRKNYIKSRASTVRSRSPSPKLNQKPKCNTHFKESLKKLPKLSEKLVEYAINMNVMSENEIRKLIIDPNKYSIFFSKIDLDSPKTAKAIKNLNLDPEKCIIQNFESFKSENLTKIQYFLAYLVHLNEKYEIFKKVLKERNHIKDLEREVFRKFKENKNFDDTLIRSTDILDRSLKKSITKELKLNLKHSRTYSPIQKHIINKNKLSLKKINADNYIKNLCIKEFDGDFFLSNKLKKINQICNKKKKLINDKKEKLKETIRKIDQKNDRNKEKEQEIAEVVYPQMIKNMEEKEIEIEKRKNEAKLKKISKISEFNEKHEKYHENVLHKKLQNELILDNTISHRIEELKNHEMDESILKSKKDKIYREKSKKKEKKIAEKLKKKKYFESLYNETQLNQHLLHYKQNYEHSSLLRSTKIEKMKLRNKAIIQESMEKIERNKSKIIQKQIKKEDLFKEKLDLANEKIIVSENIKLMRKSQLLELFSAKKQRQEELISEQNAIKKLKCNNLVEKEIEIKKKIDNIKKESDFVVLERKEYNLKLNKYRNSMLDQLKN